MCAQDTCIYKGQLTQLVHSFFNPSVNALSVRPIINPSIRMYSQGQKFGSRFLLHRRPLANSAMMSTLTSHCQWEDQTVKDWPPALVYRGWENEVANTSYPCLP